MMRTTIRYVRLEAVDNWAIILGGENGGAPERSSSQQRGEKVHRGRPG
jgi:hypothetical protein